jgi:hypothetical protein
MYLNFSVLNNLLFPTFNFNQQHIFKTTLGKGLLHPSGAMKYTNSSTDGLCVETTPGDTYCQNFSFKFKQKYIYIFTFCHKMTTNTLKKMYTGNQVLAQEAIIWHTETTN